MDVERIRKINAMALEFLKQGLVSDREEAMLQAEKLFKNQDPTSNYSQVRETLTEIKADTERVNAPAPTTASDLSSDEVKSILEQNTKFIIKTMTEFQNKLETMEREVTILKNRSASAPSPAPQMMSARQEGQPMPSSGAQNHPRSGNYKEADVSIEKFFYMGNK